MTKELDFKALAVWLHEKKFGCVSPYGTDETARRSYDIMQHRRDAAEFYRKTGKLLLPI